VGRKLYLHHLNLVNPPFRKRKRKPVVRKLKIASEEEEDENAVIQKALQLAREIEIPAEVLARESTVEAAQLLIKCKLPRLFMRKLDAQKLLKVILIITLLLKLLQLNLVHLLNLGLVQPPYHHPHQHHLIQMMYP